MHACMHACGSSPGPPKGLRRSNCRDHQHDGIFSSPPFPPLPPPPQLNIVTTNMTAMGYTDDPGPAASSAPDDDGLRVI